jgi:hypothetical protein
MPSRTHPRWEDDPDGHGGTLHVYGARSVRIEDEVLWAKWKSDVSSFPMFILNFIATKKHHGEASAIWKLESRRTGLPYDFGSFARLQQRARARNLTAVLFLHSPEPS